MYISMVRAWDWWRQVSYRCGPEGGIRTPSYEVVSKLRAEGLLSAALRCGANGGGAIPEVCVGSLDIGKCSMPLRKEMRFCQQTRFSPWRHSTHCNMARAPTLFVCNGHGCLQAGIAFSSLIVGAEWRVSACVERCS